jgi:hypothetical protein
VPGSNVTLDEAMILFTGRSIHITKMPNKPISQGYKFCCMAEKSYIWEFHPSSNAVGGDPVDVESRLLQWKDGSPLDWMFSPEALKALLQYIHGQLLHNTTSAGIALSDGDRSMWYMQTAVSKISQGAKGWEECHIAILFSKWSCE